MDLIFFWFVLHIWGNPDIMWLNHFWEKCMKTLAIISEYNPFHNGHKYQLEKAKEITGAEYSIALMSGNFLQRGEPSFWNKYIRSSMVISGGLDLVLELPFCYASGSAGDFAAGAVNILNKLNCVDYLCFGAETDDYELFDTVSDILVNESSEYTSILKDALKQGNSYAKARAIAISKIINNSIADDFLCQPNNILALEYICSLKKTSSSIKPVIIKRIQAGYNDKNIYSSISSASAIRAALEQHIQNHYVDLSKKNPDNKTDITFPHITSIANDVPEATLSVINESIGVSSPVYAEDLSDFLVSALMSRNTCLNFNSLYGDFTDICDINEDISRKLGKLQYPTSYHIIKDNLCNRQYTSSRICRALLHLIMNYTDDMRDAFFANGYAYYANILGIKKEASANLKYIKNVSSIPLITKKADFQKELERYENIDKCTAKSMWKTDIMATRLYNQLVFNRYGTVLKDDFNTILPVI